MRNTTARTCSIEGCSEAYYCRGWCRMHHQRWKTHGDPEKTLYVRTPTYASMHVRLRWHRGPAKDHVCVDCGERAKHWSYNNAGGANERVSPENRTYSLDIDDYEPRCQPCHWKLDGRTSARKRT